VQETIWLGDTPVATIRPKTGGVDIFYVHSDHLNTPRRVTRPSDNALRWKWESDAFGTTLPNENPASLGVFKYNLRFPGQLFDGAAGLHQNYFRDYDPAIGKYVESDPIGLRGGSYSTYAYVNSAPLSHTDPIGLARSMRGSKVNDTLQDLQDNLCDLWFPACITKLRVCTQARCKYSDKCGRTWYVTIDNWQPGPAPSPDEVSADTPNCLCTKWKFRNGE
jgi:RHS repeat-associated protein